jgi:hypothetical protein
MASVGSFFSGLSSSVSSAVSGVTGAAGAAGAAGGNKNKGGLGPQYAKDNTHVNYPAKNGGMGTPSQKGGRCWKKNKNKSKKNRNRKNKSRKNRK